MIVVLILQHTVMLRMFQIPVNYFQIFKCHTTYFIMTFQNIIIKKYFRYWPVIWFKPTTYINASVSFLSWTYLSTEMLKHKKHCQYFLTIVQRNLEQYQQYFNYLLSLQPLVARHCNHRVLFSCPRFSVDSFSISNLVLLGPVGGQWYHIVTQIIEGI